MGQELKYLVPNRDALPASVRARLAGGTAEIIAPERATAETAMVEPRTHRAVIAAQNPPPKPAARRR